jgi:hypothetical protein
MSKPWDFYVHLHNLLYGCSNMKKNNAFGPHFIFSLNLSSLPSFIQLITFNFFYVQTRHELEVYLLCINEDVWPVKLI